MRERFPAPTFSDGDLASMYEQYGVDKFNLQDRGYLARVHPLELWLVAYLRQHPDATFKQVVEASRARAPGRLPVALQEQGESRAGHAHPHAARDGSVHRDPQALEARSAIRSARSCPRYATAIGVSGDRPAALAELMGIIVNGGVRLPTARIEELHFAADDAVRDASCGARRSSPSA